MTHQPYYVSYIPTTTHYMQGSMGDFSFESAVVSKWGCEVVTTTAIAAAAYFPVQ